MVSAAIAALFGGLAPEGVSPQARLMYALIAGVAAAAVFEFLAWVYRFLWTAPREVYDEDQKSIVRLERERDAALERQRDLERKLIAVEDAAKKAAEVRVLSERPYVVIEELSSKDLMARSLADPRNPVLPEAAYRPGYSFAKMDRGEGFLYAFRHVAGPTPARQIRHYIRVETIDRAGFATEVPADSGAGGGEVLLPGKSAIRNVVVPDGTFFSPSVVSGDDVRLHAVLTYRGQDDDPNTYFYSVTLLTHRSRQPDGTAGIGRISVEATDEGVVKDLQTLLKVSKMTNSF